MIIEETVHIQEGLSISQFIHISVNVQDYTSPDPDVIPIYFNQNDPYNQLYWRENDH